MMMRRRGTTKVVPFHSPVVGAHRIEKAAESLRHETLRYPAPLTAHIANHAMYAPPA
jgi:hypothetical protein